MRHASRWYVRHVLSNVLWIWFAQARGLLAPPNYLYVLLLMDNPAQLWLGFVLQAKKASGLSAPHVTRHGTLGPGPSVLMPLGLGQAGGKNRPRVEPMQVCEGCLRVVVVMFRGVSHRACPEFRGPPDRPLPQPTSRPCRRQRQRCKLRARSPRTSRCQQRRHPRTCRSPRRPRRPTRPTSAKRPWSGLPSASSKCCGAPRFTALEPLAFG